MSLVLKSAATHGNEPDYEELSKAKFDQRAQAARYLSKHSTILELYAGKGMLSSQVYAKLNPRRMVLVDDDPANLEQAKAQLGKTGIRADYYPMKNQQFIKKGYLKKYPDVSLLDFDAYGTPGPLVKQFFENYRVRQPMVLMLTDGFPIHIHRRKDPNEVNTSAAVDYDDVYSLKSWQAPSLGDVCGMHDTMMKNLGARGRFKSWRINRGFGGKSGRVVYAAYLLRPQGIASTRGRPG